jgi:glycosyltransferase involved in cell wall biosynthesis
MPLIGVITYCTSKKRSDIIQKFFESLLKVNNGILRDYEVIVSDDGSTHKPFLDFLDHISSKGIKVIKSENAGISANSNRVLKYFMESSHDIVFVLNDDNEFLRPGLFDKYCQVLNGGIEHISFTDGYYTRRKTNGIRSLGIEHGTFGGQRVRRLTHTNGVILGMTRKCVEEIGGYTIGPSPWGCEHLDYSLRAAEKFNHHGFLDIENSNDFFKVLDIGEHNSNFKIAERAKYGKENTTMMAKLRKESLYREIRC